MVFQFDGSTTVTTSHTNDNDNSSLENVKSLEKLQNASYFDRLNSWLGQILQRDCPNVSLIILRI